MQELYEIFDEEAQSCPISAGSANFTIQLEALVLPAQIDENLNVKVQGWAETSTLKIKTSCLMFPCFSNLQVTCIKIYGGSKSCSISGRDNDVHQLYLKLRNVLTHKGFNEFYKPIKRLGRGTFATVYLVEHRVTGVRRAAKVFSK
jgi:serine/threonine protein kinase